MVRMVVDSILPHAECGPNDHRKDAPPFTLRFIIMFNSFQAKAIQRQLEAERQEEEARNVCPLPLPSDLSKEERELTLKAIQELTREASAFIKGRNAKKKMSSGYELGANLNQGKFL